VTGFAPKDPDYEARVRASFARQAFMGTCGARITALAPGEVVLEIDAREDLTQQHGFLHAGVLASIADSACGYAALTLMPKGRAVLSVEFKLNLLAPARGTRFRATGRVLKPGRTLTVCSAEVVAVDEGTLVAVLQGTMIALEERPGLTD
jgi:uncharacterized protein (TIGR00369 family)